VELSRVYKNSLCI